jgi:hypothetical protein
MFLGFRKTLEGVGKFLGDGEGSTEVVPYPDAYMAITPGVSDVPE